ncbi:4-hydroxythreonine-4-phosphate dehydrogenase PdxA [Roseomonas sp. BN140053]|uniref:4-hydroxythreonine-4-phosphate dehydrogenase PdxA n=1 Tax=Roseomonas sp. BN140053 TaxID=3391898 RepID=UPI0039E76E10
MREPTPPPGPGAPPPVLALTMGDPAGIGGELTVAAWCHLRDTSSAPFIFLGDPEHLAAVAPEIPVAELSDLAEAAAVFPDRLPVLPIRLPTPAIPGQPDPRNAPAVITAIETAVRLAQAGRVGAVVTNPISKATLYRSGFGFPGHTEFLGALCDMPEAPVMMLASPMLRVVPVTVHVSLQRAIRDLSTAAILATGLTLARSLREDFGLSQPRIAVAGLNPHAGEDGAMGEEDAAIVAPAVAALRRHGVAATGPLPADTMFTPRARAGYDAALCMYHDQALIPLKTLDMDGGVNVTLGLSIIRTSPDHGTAFDIAGTGRADPGSLLAALRMAAELATHRAARSSNA